MKNNHVEKAYYTLVSTSTTPSDDTSKLTMQSSKLERSDSIGWRKYSYTTVIEEGTNSKDSDTTNVEVGENER